MFRFVKYYYFPFKNAKKLEFILLLTKIFNFLFLIKTSSIIYNEKRRKHFIMKLHSFLCESKLLVLANIFL